MISIAGVLVALHVLANVVWIGALLSVVMLLSRAASGTADVSVAGGLARAVHVRLAAPAFMTSFAAGLVVILLAPRVYARLPWMHAKLSFALVVIVLHHVIGARARRVAAGDRAAANVAVLGGVVFVCAAVAVFLGVLKP
jgi:protoporphyrinogen IX oxidase